MDMSVYGLGLIIIPVLLSLTLHEFGHARVALAFGDDTAGRMGRVTLNPLAHLDLLGSVCFLFGPVGWAKPVPVVAANLRPPRLGDIAVSLAGVGMNALLVLLAAAALVGMSAAGVQVDRLATSTATAGGVAAFMLVMTIRLNVSLLLFNLLPLYPLDGHHVIRELLPARLRDGYMAWQHRVGQPLLVMVMVAPWLLAKVQPDIDLNLVGAALGLVFFAALGLLPDPAQSLAADAVVRYRHFLPW